MTKQLEPGDNTATTTFSRTDRRSFLQGAAVSAAALSLPRWARGTANPAAGDLDAIRAEIEKGR